MIRSRARRVWTGLLLFGLFAVLSACGSMGGNDEGDDDKFPEPPDRPSSAQVVAPSPTIAPGASARPRDGGPHILRPIPPSSS